MGWAAAAVAATVTFIANGQGVGYTVVLEGLKSPRGLTFAGAQGPKGNGARLFVAEAGGVEGNNSAIDEVVGWQTDQATKRVVANGFTSSEEVGVDGISALSNGTIYAVTGESEPITGREGTGHLYKVNTGGGVRDVADVGTVGYNFTQAHPELDPGQADNPDNPFQFPDANPYGVLALGGHIYVTDAGANTVNEVSPNGEVTILAYIENTILADSTPTSIVQGPDGAIYVGILALLDSFVFGPSAKIYRFEESELTGETIPIIGADHEWATGLFPIHAMAAGNGNLYISELFVNGDVGDVVKIPFSNPASRTSLTGATLPFPGGVAVAPNGTVYAVGGAVFPNGFVARLDQR
jgi:hypothetical protein